MIYIILGSAPHFAEADILSCFVHFVHLGIIYESCSVDRCCWSGEARC